MANILGQPRKPCLPLLFKRSPEAESELMQLDQHHREEDVPHDDGCKGAVAQGDEAQTAHKEDNLPAQCLPGEFLELERHHGHLTHQQIAEEQGEGYDPHDIEAQRGEESMLTQHQRTPKEPPQATGRAFRE